MNLNTAVSEIMTASVIQVQVDTELTEVLHLLKQEKIRHLPVAKGNQLVGIVSRTDINRLTFGTIMEDQAEADEAILDMLSLSQVMSTNVRVVKDSDTIKDVATIFASEEFHALPVVDSSDEWQCVGIITTTDIIKHLLSTGG